MLVLFEGGDIMENVQKILPLPFYVMFLKCFLIPFYFAFIISILKVFFLALALVFVGEWGDCCCEEYHGRGGKGFDLVCANYETNYPPELFGMIYLDKFNFLYHS